LKESPEEHGILALAEFRRLFNEEKLREVLDGDHSHYALNLTATSRGLRVGEVFGLTVQHVHPEYLEIVLARGQVDGLHDPKCAPAPLHKPRPYGRNSGPTRKR
jgi:hypothetical protein